uniref:Protein transport protein sec31 isoform X1 n=1 Tax=Nicotiana tabacum TaxID=4097 RepID=A0A1S4BB01_TOBAC|nr:PREDICTED: protein transport protein sec31-like isoform X1 [Nicotiana tabacum]XP_016486053.1 PREDICTED: protein transport protein sec31-like isoform X1 [Nicotiana tabacum]
MIHHTSVCAPNYHKFWVFGCLCYPWLRPYSQNKFEPLSSPCIFLGYSTNQSAYICYDLQKHKIYVFRRVNFVEHESPYSKSLVIDNLVADNTVLTWAPHYIIPLPTGSTNSMAPPSTGASSSLTPSSCKALGTSNSYQGTTSLSSSSILSPASPDSSSVQEHRSLAVTTVEPMSLSDPISTHSMPSSLPIFSPLASTGTPEHMEISVSPALSTAPPPPPSQNSHHMVTRS